jgi:hypothetical protein
LTLNKLTAEMFAAINPNLVDSEKLGMSPVVKHFYSDRANRGHEAIGSILICPTSNKKDLRGASLIALLLKQS